MAERSSDERPGVGPVLEASERGRAVLTAIRELNPGVRVEDRGAYLRVSVVGRCLVTREAIERALGAPFRLRVDLERVMPAFRGSLRLDEERVEWSSEQR